MKEPITVCYRDIVAGNCPRAKCTEIIKIEMGDYEARNRKGKVVAIFHQDCLEWVRPTPKKGAI